MSNSKLVSYTRLSPNHSGPRTHKIDRITPHCVVGQCSVETLGGIFAPTSRQASSNYGIGADGRVGMYVAEGNRSWCSSSNANDQRAVTIECASDLTPPYAFKPVVWNKLVDLCVDICKRNGKTKLLWLGSKEKALSYTPKSNEMILTAHKWFANTACPGSWMYSREGQLAKEVTAKLQKSSSSSSKTTTTTKTTYKVVEKSGMNIRKGAGTNTAVIGKIAYNKTFTSTKKKGDWAYADSYKGWVRIKNGNKTYLKKVTSTSTKKKSNEEIAKEVIAGKWGNGTTRKKKLEAAGYNYATIQALVNKML